MSQRVISTSQELLALPIGAVVRSPNGETWERREDDNDPDWREDRGKYGCDRWTSTRSTYSFYAESVGLPATVLYPTYSAVERGVCETCKTPIEKRSGIWQHSATRLIACAGTAGAHAYPRA